MRLRTWLLGLSGLSVAVVVACGSDNSVFDSGEVTGEGPGSNDPSLLMGEAGVGAEDAGKPTNTGDGASCASSKATAALTKRPVDIVFLIDNSGSMSGEIVEVQKQINQNFATIIGASGLDYRIIMVSRYGAAYGDESICVSSPLSGSNCDAIFPDAGAAVGDAGKPAETARFFQYNQEIASEDAWCRLLDAFAKADNSDGYTLHPTGYGPLLRPEAFKTVVVMSDDGINCSVDPKNAAGTSLGNRSYNDNGTVDGGWAAATKLDTDLRALAPTQFGDGDGGRNYVFHAIVAVAPFNGDAGLGDPNMHPPTAPVVTGMCTPGAEEPATGHQALAVLTGGYRYPSCTLSYTSIFQKMAEGVVKSSAMSCDFAVPQPPPGETLDLSTLAVQYTPGSGGAVQEFTLASDLASCAPGKFWLEGGASGTVHLCPDTCTMVKTDLKANVSVVSGCARINPTQPTNPKR